MKKTDKSRQIDKKNRKDIPIDSGMHQLVKIKAAKEGITIKTLVEGYIAEGLKGETAGN